MELDLFEIWNGMNNLVRGVVLILTLQALGTIAVVVDRTLLLALSNRKSRKFAADAGPKLAKGDFDATLSVAKEHKGSHLAAFVETGVRTFKDRHEQGHSREKSAEFVRRALERRGETLSASLNRGMNILASTGSTAPFVGLLGTVLGILNAFKLIAAEGSGGMGTIGAAIGEALIVTGYGLMVAIPTVLLFNWLNGRIAKYEAGLANAGSELVDQLEAGSLRMEDSSPGLEPAVETSRVQSVAIA
jgi:biopolymer transport protein ExbB/TolQ